MKTYRIEAISFSGNPILIKHPYSYNIDSTVKRCEKLAKQEHISHCIIYSGDIDNEKREATVYGSNFHNNIEIKNQEI